MKGKKAALEMSIGTIVVVVLAMTMLILGLVLIKSIMTGAKYNVDTLNDKVKGEILKLFDEDNSAPVIVYLADNKADIKQGGDWGVAFGVKNLDSGSTASTFSYEVTSGSSVDELKTNCGINENEALSYISLGKTGQASIIPGQIQTFLVRIQAPKTAPICMIRYNIEVKQGTAQYQTAFFDLNIK